MPKAKTIDRIAYTRDRLNALKVNGSSMKVNCDSLQKPSLDKCPACGAFAVVHVQGCMNCLTCGWSACN